MAVTTTEVQSVVGSWTDLGIGPMIIWSENVNNIFAFADVIPPTTLVGVQLGDEYVAFMTWPAAWAATHVWVRGPGIVSVSR